jgi:Fe-S-cluster containining protein
MMEGLVIGEWGESEKDGCICRGGQKIIGLKFDVFDRPIDIQVGILSEEARLADIVPLAWSISAKIANLAVEEIREEGGQVPCRQGCSSCCRYLVPVSVPEAFRMMEGILNTPAGGRRIMLRRCFLAARRILSERPPKSFADQLEGTLSVSENQQNRVANWYSCLKLVCPFQHRNSCTIYESRPLACREHFVKGSARGCRGGRGTAEMIEMPVRMPEALCLLASEFEGRGMEAVMMPLMPTWYEENKQRSEKKYPAAAMVERLGEILKTMAKEKTVLSTT